MNKGDTLEPKLVPPRGILYRRADAPMTGYARYWPAPDLLPFVEHLWTVEWDLETPTVSEVLTHPSAQMVIERGASQVAGVFTTRYVRRLEGRGRVLGTKFRPGGFRAFWRRPVSELRDRSLPLHEVFGDAAAELEPKALAHADHAAAFAVVQEFLRAREPRADAQLDLVARLAERAAARRDILRVDQLARDAGLGVRTLQRLFDDYVGVSPKWVIQRYRLHEAAERIAAGQVDDLASLALDVGYADQAHFSRDFKRLVGASPAAYARRI